MPGNFIQFDQLPMADRNKSTEQQIEDMRNYIKGVMDQLRYELRRLGGDVKSIRNGGNSKGGSEGDGGSGSKADSFGYPVGSIYISTRSTNPAFLFGGTWVQLENRFLLGAGSDYEAGRSGGEATHALTAEEMPSHSHSVGAHAHGLNSHVHTVGAHSHGLNSHVHSVGAHAHGLNSHTHTLSSHTHTTDIGHGHGFTQPGIRRTKNAASGTARYAIQGSETTDMMNAINGAVQYYSGSKTSGGPSNNTSGAASGSTANSTAFNTGAASGSTANSNAFNTGAASGNTELSAAFNTGSTGGGNGHNNMPPYLVVYIWERTE